MKNIFIAGQQYKSTFPGRIYRVYKRTKSTLTLMESDATLPITKKVKTSDLGEFVNLGNNQTLYAKDIVTGGKNG